MIAQKLTPRKLLESSLRCVEKLLEENFLFLKNTEPFSMKLLSAYEKKRTKIISTLRLYDKKMGALLTGSDQDLFPPELKAEVRALLDKKDQLLKKITELDENIIAEILEEKSRLGTSIKFSMNEKERLKKFKSSWLTQCGDGLDQKL